MPKLSDAKIRNAKPRPKAFKLYDADGLYIVITPNGGRWWRHRYHWHGREQLLSLGTYPEIDLATARDRRDEARKQVSNGVNPSTHRQQKAALRGSAERSYEAVSLQWREHTTKFKQWTQDHVERVKRRQEVHFHPWIGKKQVDQVTDDEVLACVLQTSRITSRARWACSSFR